MLPVMMDDSFDDDNLLPDDARPLHDTTPLLHSAGLSVKLLCNIYLKLENMQPSGSVKMRGVGHFCYRKVQSQGREIQFVCGSGINVVLAVAYAARQLGVDAIVVMPTSASEQIRHAAQAEGAQLILHGDNWSAAESHARKLVNRNRIYVPPSDHELVWQGHSTIVHELKSQLSDKPPVAIICPVGAGGLLNGVIIGLQEVGWKEVLVIAVETHGSSAFQASVVAGKMVQLQKISTIASSLAAKSVCPKSLELSLVHPVVPFAVSDAMAADATRMFSEDSRFLVEAASGAALSLCYTQIIRDLVPGLSFESDVVVLVTGGSDISLSQMDEYRQKYMCPPVVVKSGSEVFLKMNDALTNVHEEVSVDDPTGISKKALHDLCGHSIDDKSIAHDDDDHPIVKTPTPN